MIADALEAVERGEVKRLMIEAPPRHTKSELASRRFPAWYLGKHPDRQIICSTYSGDFATDFGREVRNIISSQSYQNLFNVKLAEDSRAANRWHTQDNGIYVSVGIGGPITGRGAHVALIDDPIKNRMEADSQTNRDMVWNWYSSTLRTRLMPSGAIVLIMTRWHEDDLAGRLLEQQSDRWERVRLVAIEDEETEKERALWPQWYPIEDLKEIKAEITERDWQALYQQNPTPEQGNYFKREWFEENRYRLGEAPKTNNYQASDFATKDADGDFTEHGVFGMDHRGHLWVLDWWYGQKTADIWIDKQLDQVKDFKTFASFGEQGQIRRAVEPFQVMRCKKRRIWPRFEWINRSGDKKAMARAFQGMASMGMIHIPKCEWGDRLIEQLVSFDTGKYDDAVDVCALIGMAINMAHEAILDLPEDETPKQHNADYGYDDEGGSWMTI